MKGLIYLEQGGLFGSLEGKKKEIIGYGDEDFCVKEVDKNLACKIIRANHYSKKVYNATYIHLGVYIQRELLGILQYGYAMNPMSGASVVEGTKKHEYLELNRMWLDDKAVRNSESKAISYSIKYISNKFRDIKWIQSFADERCGRHGVVYQACSFKYYGEHTSDFWELDGVVYHNIQMTVSKGTERYAGDAQFLQENKERAIKMTLRQFRYIKFLDQKWVSRCCLKECHYPKHYIDLTDLNF